MEQSELLETTLINLRSVIQSIKGGIPLNNLQNDYKAFIGKHIPFNNLGYNSLLEFIESIPNVVKLKKNAHDVLFAEAVTDASTSHLASLISRQKGPSSKKIFKSSCVSKKYGFRRQNSSKLKSTASSSCNSLISETSYDNDQEFTDLKLALEKEKETNKTLLSQVTHLQSVIKKHQGSLIEQETAKKSVISTNENQLPDRTSPLLMEMKDLKLKLKIEENNNISLSSEITKLTSLMLVEQEKLSAERKKVQQLQSQLEDLQKKMILKCSVLNGVKWDESLEIKKKAESLDWNDNLLETNLPKSITTSQAINPNPLISQFDFYNIHKEQCIQVNDLKNQVKQQREHMTVLRKELKQQKLLIHDLTVQMKKLSSEPPKIEVDMDLAVQMLLKHLNQSPQTQQLMSNASAFSDNSITSSEKSHTSEDQKNVILKIHNLLPSENQEHIKAVLQFYDGDESKAVDALLRNGSTEALNHVVKTASLINKKLPQSSQVVSEKPCVSIKDNSVGSTAKKSRNTKKKKKTSAELTSITAVVRDSCKKS